MKNMICFRFNILIYNTVTRVADLPGGAATGRHLPLQRLPDAGVAGGGRGWERRALLRLPEVRQGKREMKDYKKLT